MCALTVNWETAVIYLSANRIEFDINKIVLQANSVQLSEMKVTHSEMNVTHSGDAAANQRHGKIL